MNLGRTTIVLMLLAGLLGCGGGGNGDGGSIPTRIDVIAAAPTHGTGQGLSQLTGFVGGKPAFLSYVDSDHWQVSVVGETPVDLSTTPYANAFLITFGDGIVVGGYDSGCFTYRKTASGWQAATFPGLTDPVLDGKNARLIGTVSGAYKVIDIESGLQTPLTLPANSTLYLAKGNWLVYRTAATSTFFVRSLESGAEWEGATIPGDTTFFPYAVNDLGGVLGNSSNGSVGRVVYWQPSSGEAQVVDSYPGATVEPGWVSPDGTKFVINVATGGFQSFVYVGGTKYVVADLEGGSGVPYLYGLSSDGRFGFGYSDGFADPDSGIAVKITYR